MSCAAAAKVLEVFKEDKILDNVALRYVSPPLICELIKRERPP